MLPTFTPPILAPDRAGSRVSPCWLRCRYSLGSAPVGACRYCGKDAGLMRSVHHTCRHKLQAALTSYVSGTEPLAQLQAVATELKASADARSAADEVLYAAP